MPISTGTSQTVKELIMLDKYMGLIEGVQQITALIKAFYDAYVQQGFTESQALALCCAHIQALVSNTK